MSSQRTELTDTFRSMSDEELLERWQSGNLTAVAVEVAQAEFERRQIEVAPFEAIEAQAEDHGPEDAVSFVMVARSLEPWHLEILRARLQAEGIEAFVADGGINKANPFYSIAVGGVRLMVPRASAELARRIVDLVRSGQFALRDDDELG
jgi:hypothetical protein